MNRHSERLAKLWQQAAKDLGIEVSSGYRAYLSDGVVLVVAVFIQNFGAEKGMLLVTEPSLLRPFEHELLDAGYGYSVFSEPTADEVYDREAYVELLRDWGWTGRDGAKPKWL